MAKKKLAEILQGLAAKEAISSAEPEKDIFKVKPQLKINQGVAGQASIYIYGYTQIAKMPDTDDAMFRSAEVNKYSLPIFNVLRAAVKGCSEATLKDSYLNLAELIHINARSRNAASVRVYIPHAKFPGDEWVITRYLPGEGYMTAVLVRAPIDPLEEMRREVIGDTAAYCRWPDKKGRVLTIVSPHSMVGRHWLPRDEAGSINLNALNFAEDIDWGTLATYLKIRGHYRPHRRDVCALVKRIVAREAEIAEDAREEEENYEEVAEGMADDGLIVKSDDDE